MLKPLFKYPGGKSSEYPIFKHMIPKHQRYVEPFIGGGAVYWADSADDYLINDYSGEITSIYTLTRDKDSLFLNYFKELSLLWDNKQGAVNPVMLELEKALFNNEYQIKVPVDALETLFAGKTLFLPYYDVFLEEFCVSFKRKIASLRKIQEDKQIKNLADNALGVIGASIYMMVRKVYNSIDLERNQALKTVLFFFLREFSYSSMFRYNSSGGFNVPFGGNTYAKKSLFSRYEQLIKPETIKKLEKTEILTGDFSNALIDSVGTFIFLDPPYDSDFSTYNQTEFDKEEQVRLRNSLINLSKSKWLLVIKNTDFILDLYSRKGWYISRFTKNYSVNFKNRNNQSVEHLIITNYNPKDILNGN
ncbi:DNA adenine methylase [Fructobacillus fructosus]|uniref:DNA adenine methylase n=1 Tax=Fructobacillus fructosus TaxID=1631 RepID=UPI002D8BF54C|nr:DNA-adenine methylase (Dam) [Fructobacillus fructosus]CAK1251360.1 DNA-adenine methylase (Dam) [Fructobacillus fructosus]CAK1251811.1 DNA-adenine methylase (Dam) [Fructobacillus fructosus]